MAILRIEPGSSSATVQSTRPVASGSGASHRHEMGAEQRYPSAGKRKAAGAERIRGNRRQTGCTTDGTCLEQSAASISVHESKPTDWRATGRRWAKYLSIHLMRALQGCSHRKSARNLTVVQSTAVGEKRSVALIECDGERYLIGVGVDISLLARLGKTLKNDSGEAQ